MIRFLHRRHSALRLRGRRSLWLVTFAGFLVLLGTGCGEGGDSQSPQRPKSESRGGGGEGRSHAGPGAKESRGGSGHPGVPPGQGGPPGRSGGEAAPGRGVPVEAEAVERRSMASYFETQGTLEAENEVDLVARTSGPVTRLSTEEGQAVRVGQELARIDDRELQVQLQVARVRLEETQAAYDRIKSLFESLLVSQETHDQALANFQSAQGEVERIGVQLGYTVITAPFAGLVVERYVKLAQNLSNGDRLFRLSDFDPLLCPIRVPERQLPKLRPGQNAELMVEAWPEKKFSARVLRISPVVDAATGTVKVTLQVDGDGLLRPGMFAGVFLELDRNPQALVIPKSALALDSLGDTAFVVENGVASRRSLVLGFQSDDLLEVVDGLSEGELVVTVGQEGLSDGTPVEVVRARPEEGSPEGEPANGGEPAEAIGANGPGGPFSKVDWDDPAQVEQVRETMRSRGLGDDAIDERLRLIRQRQQSR